MADADGDQFHRRAGLDLLDHLPQMTLEVATGVDRQRRIVDRRAVRDHHQDAPLFRPAKQAIVRPGQGFAVDVLLQQPFAHHEGERALRAPPGRVGLLVDDVAQVVQAAGTRGLAGGEPRFPRLPTFPGARGETENFHLHAAALQCARENVGTAGSDHDRPPAHASRVVEQQRDDRVLEVRVLLALERQRMHGIDDDARQTGRVQRAFLEIEFPGAVLLREQLALQLVRQTRDHARQVAQLLVEERTQPLKLIGCRQLVGVDLFVVGARKHLVAEPLGVIEHAGVRAPRLARVGHVVAFGVGIEIVGLAGLGRFISLAFFALGALLLGGLVVAIRIFSVFLRFRLAAVGLLLLLAVALLRLAVGEFFRKFERPQHVAQCAAEGGLILGGLFQPCEGLGALFLDEWPPHIDHALGTGRRREAGELLAHHQGQRLLDRRLALLGDLGVAAVRELVLDLGGEVVGHARHAHGADGFDARALGRLEHGTRRAGTRRQAVVQLRIMPGRRQREAVGPAADDRDLLGRGHARGFRQLHVLAVELRLARRVRDLHFALAGDGARGKPKHPLEWLGGGFFLLRRCGHDARQG